MELQPDKPVTRQLSLALVMDAIIQHGPISRVQIAKLTRLSKQTASDVVRELLEAAWVQVHGQTQGPVGRTAVTYEIRPEAAFVAGIDLGGSQLRMAIADLACAVVAEGAEATSPRGGQAVIAQILALAARLAADAGIAPDRVRLVVLGTPGVVEPATGSIQLAPNIPEFDRIDVVGLLRRGFGANVVVENDVNIATLGERWLGRARGVDNFAYVAMGTGLGMGIVAGGQLLRGARGAAGEIANLPLGGDPFDRTSQLHGPLESAVGSAGILQRYQAEGGQAGVTVRDLFARLATDAAARQVIDDTARLLALAIVSVAAVIDPEVIVLGGSIGVRPELIAAIQDRLDACMMDPIPIAASALGNRAGLVGALAIGINNIHNALFAPSFSPRALALPAIDGLRGPRVAA